jgi:hypothetical protein
MASKDPQLRDELRGMREEPLLPVEKQLVAGSIVLGIVLLVLLVWVSRTYFPS